MPGKSLKMESCENTTGDNMNLMLCDCKLNAVGVMVCVHKLLLFHMLSFSASEIGLEFV